MTLHHNFSDKNFIPERYFYYVQGIGWLVEIERNNVTLQQRIIVEHNTIQRALEISHI